jgi:hypothetical protein
MGINYFYGHFEGGGIRGILCYGINHGIFMEHQKLIYSTELRLNTMKNSFLFGDFD